MFKHSKLKKTFSLFLVLTLFLAVLPGVSLADEPIDSDDTVTAPSIYDPTLVFPDYASATTYREKIAATQLPEYSLDSVSTEYLVHVILSTPGILDVFAAKDGESGDALEEIVDTYNTLAELETRSDSGKVLLETYAAIDFESIANDEGEYSFLSRFSPIVLEVLLGRNVHFNRLTAEQRQSLFSLTALTVEKKVLYDVCGGGFKNVFYENLDTSAAEYYNSNFVVNTLPARVGSGYTSVMTYGGRSISAYIWENGDTDYTESEKEDIANSLYEQHGIYPISPATKKYNCHSYAWHMPSTSNLIWIPSASGYINCSSSVEKSSASDANIIVYFSASGETLHSGVINGYSNGVLMVTSKWDQKGLYTHAYDNVPSIYTPSGWYVKYYSYTVHKSGWTYQNENYHSGICTLCGITMPGTGQHYWAYYDGGSAKHTKKCNACNYSTTEVHTFYYECAAATHTECCSVCGREGEAELHTLNSARTECTICGYTGPFSTIMSIAFGV